MGKIKKMMLLSVVFMLSAHSCIKERDENSDDKLTLERTEYTGSELRTDGYYYKKDKYINVFFLYKNGIIFNVGTSPNFEEVEERCRNGFYGTYVKSKWSWGVFQVNGTQIKYEKWVPVEGPLIAVTYVGTIVNDTTYTIYESYANINGEKKRNEHHMEFHFREFSPKPDSVNRFIE